MGLKNCEKRYINIKKGVEIRAEEKDGERFVNGFIPYNKRSVDMGWDAKLFEILSPGCFNKTLADKTEVKAFHNHNDDEVLGNTKSGTLELTDTEKGLEIRCKFPNTTYANDLYEVIKRGDCTTMSFGMIVVKEEFARETDEEVVRYIKEAALDEVSFGVAYPAYPDTDSKTALRSLKSVDMDSESREIILKLAEELRNADSEQQPNEGTEEEKAKAAIQAEEEKRRKEQDERDRIATAFLFANQ